MCGDESESKFSLNAIIHSNWETRNKDHYENFIFFSLIQLYYEYKMEFVDNKRTLNNRYQDDILRFCKEESEDLKTIGFIKSLFKYLNLYDQTDIWSSFNKLDLCDGIWVLSVCKTDKVVIAELSLAVSSMFNNRYRATLETRVNILNQQKSVSYKRVRVKDGLIIAGYSEKINEKARLEYINKKILENIVSEDNFCDSTELSLGDTVVLDLFFALIGKLMQEDTEFGVRYFFSFNIFQYLKKNFISKIKGWLQTVYKNSLVYSISENALDNVTESVIQLQNIEDHFNSFVDLIKQNFNNKELKTSVKIQDFSFFIFFVFKIKEILDLIKMIEEYSRSDSQDLKSEIKAQIKKLNQRIFFELECSQIILQTNCVHTNNDNLGKSQHILTTKVSNLPEKQVFFSNSVAARFVGVRKNNEFIDCLLSLNQKESFRNSSDSTIIGVKKLSRRSSLIDFSNVNITDLSFNGASYLDNNCALKESFKKFFSLFSVIFPVIEEIKLSQLPLNKDANNQITKKGILKNAENRTVFKSQSFGASRKKKNPSLTALKQKPDDSWHKLKDIVKKEKLVIIGVSIFLFVVFFLLIIIRNKKTKHLNNNF